MPPNAAGFDRIRLISLSCREYWVPMAEKPGGVNGRGGSGSRPRNRRRGTANRERCTLCWYWRKWFFLASFDKSYERLSSSFSFSLSLSLSAPNAVQCTPKRKRRPPLTETKPHAIARSDSIALKKNNAASSSFFFLDTYLAP